MSDFRSSVIQILSGKISLKLLGLVFTPLLVRAFTQAQYGQFVSILAVIQIAENLVNVGLFQSTTKHTAEADEGERTSVLVSSLFLSVSYALVVGTVLVVAASFVGGSLVVDTAVVVILVGTMLFRNPFEAVRGYLYGIRRERAAQVANVLRKTAYTIVGLAAAFSGFGVLAVVAGHPLSFVLGVLLVSLYLLWSVDFEKQDLTIRVGLTSRVARYGFVNLIGFLAATLLYKVDILLIRFFIGETAVAEYQAAIFSAELIWVIPGAIQGVLLQDTAGKWVDQSMNEINQTLRTSVKYGTMAIVLLGGGLLLLSREFLAVYFGSDYVTSTLPLQVLLFGAALYGLNRVYAPVLQAVGELKLQQATNVAALLLNVLLNLLLIPRFGVLGAAVGTSLSYGSVIVGSLLIFRRTPIQPYDRGLLVRLAVLSGGFLVLYGGIVTQVSLRPVVSLIVMSPLGAIIFALLAHVIGLVDLRQFLSSVKHAIGAS